MLAIYRKYRPKNLGELLGQEHIVEILRNAARQDKFSHAYLFFGPRGSGKQIPYQRAFQEGIHCVAPGLF